MADEDLKETIATTAAGPASVSGKSGSATAHSLSDLIEADKHLANRNAASGRKGFGLRFVQINPPGTQ